LPAAAAQFQKRIREDRAGFFFRKNFSKNAGGGFKSPRNGAFACETPFNWRVIL
jgi:hypothetical protein